MIPNFKNTCIETETRIDIRVGLAREKSWSEDWDNFARPEVSCGDERRLSGYPFLTHFVGERPPQRLGRKTLGLAPGHSDLDLSVPLPSDVTAVSQKPLGKTCPLTAVAWKPTCTLASP